MNTTFVYTVGGKQRTVCATVSEEIQKEIAQRLMDESE